MERSGKYLVIAITVLAFVLGGTTQIWAKAILFASMGISVALFSPQRLPKFAFTLVIILLAAWGATAFLPSALAGMPAWRTSLTEDMGIPLGGMISAQPWVSFESFLGLVASCCWILYVMSITWGDEDRRSAIRLLCWSITILAAVSLVCHFTGITIKHWGSSLGQNLGPFPNRNHLSTLLSIGAVLSATCAYDINRRRGKSWPLYTIPLAILFVTIVVNNSRAGVVLFFGGLAAWLVLVSVASKSAARIAIAGSVLVSIAAMFFAFGGDLLKRFALNQDFISTLSTDGRVPIYLDSINLAAKSPFFGIGLGNFEGVFSMVQEHYWNNDNRPIHPESDWFWLLVELGIPGVLLAGGAIFLVVKSFGGIRPQRDSLRHQHRLRIGAIVAALITPMHGFFDIPGHILGTAMPAALLFSLASRRRGAPSPTQSRKGIQLLRLAAIPILAAAAFATALSLFNMPLPSKTGALQHYAKSVQASYQGDAVASYESTDRAAKIAPLQWEYYFMRALQSLESNHGYREAQMDFRRARFLEQQWPTIPKLEAEFWLDHRPQLALPAWRELLERDPTRQHEHFQGMVRSAKVHPELADSLKALAKLSPRLQVQLLQQLNGGEFETALAEFIQGNPDLEKLPDAERERLFGLWASKGNRAELIKTLEGNRSWMKTGWKHVATSHAESGDFRSATETARQFIPAPPVPTPPTGSSLGKLENDFYLNPTDPTRGLALWAAQVSAGDSEQALETLNKVSVLPQAPGYCEYLKAKNLRTLERYREAWEAFLSYDKSTR